MRAEAARRRRALARSTRAFRRRLATRTGAAELERLPELAFPLVPDFPRLNGVAELLAATAHPPPADVRRRAALLRIALDFELQPRQGSPMDGALRGLQSRESRYDHALLATFGDLMQLK